MRKPRYDRPMHYAICNETFEDWPLKRACDFVAECGYRCLEVVA